MEKIFNLNQNEKEHKPEAEQLDINFEENKKTNELKSDGVFEFENVDGMEKNKSLDDTDEDQEELTPELLEEIRINDPALFSEIIQKMESKAEQDIKDEETRMNKMAEDLSSEALEQKRKELDELYKNDPNEEYWKK